MILEKAVETAKKRAILRLETIFGIEEKMTVKIKPQSKMRGRQSSNWIGCYRGNSILSARGIPIFWIAENIQEIMESANIEESFLVDVVFDTITHEYAHAIQELVTYRAPELHLELSSLYHKTEATFEDFAEDFAMFCSSRQTIYFDEEEIYVFFKKVFSDFGQACYN